MATQTLDLHAYGPKTLPRALMADLNRGLPPGCQIAQVTIKRLTASGRVTGTWVHTAWVEVFAYTMTRGGTTMVQSAMDQSGYFTRTAHSYDSRPTDWPGADLHARYEDLRAGVLGLIRWLDDPIDTEVSNA